MRMKWITGLLETRVDMGRVRKPVFGNTALCQTFLLQFPQGDTLGMIGSVLDNKMGVTKTLPRPALYGVCYNSGCPPWSQDYERLVTPYGTRKRTYEKPTAVIAQEG